MHKISQKSNPLAKQDLVNSINWLHYVSRLHLYYAIFGHFGMTYILQLQAIPDAWIYVQSAMCIAFAAAE